ncbi:MAG: hypothetical protein ACK4NR_10460 [Micavibrio sp.]
MRSLFIVVMALAFCLSKPSLVLADMPVPQSEELKHIERAFKSIDKIYIYKGGDISSRREFDKINVYSVLASSSFDLADGMINERIESQLVNMGLSKPNIIFRAPSKEEKIEKRITISYNYDATEVLLPQDKRTVIGSIQFTIRVYPDNGDMLPNCIGCSYSIALPPESFFIIEPVSEYALSKPDGLSKVMNKAVRESVLVKDVTPSFHKAISFALAQLDDVLREYRR